MRSRSRMSLTRRTSRSVLPMAISIICRIFSGRALSAPPATSPSAARSEVSGVRSSCETVEMNSSFMRSSALRSLMSVNATTTPTARPGVPLDSATSSDSIQRARPFPRSRQLPPLCRTMVPPAASPAQAASRSRHYERLQSVAVQHIQPRSCCRLCARRLRWRYARWIVIEAGLDRAVFFGIWPPHPHACDG